MNTRDGFVGRLLGNTGRFSDGQVAQTIELLLAHGAKRGASDIHIEPGELGVVVRYRIDGQLHGMHKLPLAALAKLTAQLKELAGLPPAPSQLPQSGQWQADVAGELYTVILSTLPLAAGGEKIVLRLKPAEQSPLSLEETGLWGANLAAARQALTSAHGLILVAGPKHSGAGQILYSMLATLARPTASIVAIETESGPAIPGVLQTRAAAALPALQAALRQDANIIMLRAAANQPALLEHIVTAASQGQLVLARLYADDAAQALSYAAHAAPPFLLSNSLRLVIAQRRVRQLCVKCRERYAPSAEEIKAIEQRFGLRTPAARQQLHRLEQQAIAARLGDAAPASTTPAHLTHLWRAHPSGCEACHHTGYQGQITLAEVAVPGPRLAKALLAAAEPAAMHTAALAGGLIPLELDGLVKALRGLTTVPELLPHLTPRR